MYLSEATKPNPFLLVDRDSPSWSEPDEHTSERAKRRGIVNTFLAARSYWKVVDWLSVNMPAHQKFLSLEEALAQARLDFAIDPTDAKRARVVVASYFLAARWHWLNETREAV